METVNNKITLRSNIDILLKKNVYTCLEIYSRANKIFLLKDYNQKIYILLIPNSPQNKTISNALKDLGYKEKWKGVNYTKQIIYSDSNKLDELTDSIQYIVNNLFNVESDSKWRYEISSGMSVIKDMSTPLLTASEHRKKNKRFKISNLLKSSNSISIGKIIFYSKRYNNYFKQFGFSKSGDRYTAYIQGYRTELTFSKIQKIIIVVYHKEVIRNKDINMPKTSVFSSSSYNWTGQFYSQKIMHRLLSKSNTIKHANAFVNLIKSLNIEKQ